MISTKTFSLKQIISFTGHHIIWIVIWCTAAALLYKYVDMRYLVIPWLPLSVIGTAVAFYLGFKNNSAYDRMWEARKIWGAIVNSSRAWGSSIKGFVGNLFRDDELSHEEIHDIRKRLIYRHVGWLYALRSQLLVITEWEHANQGGLIGKTAKRYRKQFGVGLIDDQVTKSELHQFLPKEEYDKLINCKNTATQIIDRQSEELAELRANMLIDDFRHMELQKILNDFYVQQGKCERIKKFPLPRQYANMSAIFVGIFIFLLPFGMVSEFMKLGEFGIWFSIPFASVVAYIYIVMEIVGDYSENPFQGMANDIPMLSLCRVIEIDLRQMLGEKDLPESVQSVDGILM